MILSIYFALFLSPLVSINVPSPSIISPDPTFGEIHTIGICEICASPKPLEEEHIIWIVYASQSSDRVYTVLSHMLVNHKLNMVEACPLILLALVVSV